MSGGYFGYIQRNLEDVSSEIEEIINLEEEIQTGEVLCKEETNVYALKKVSRDGVARVLSDSRFISYKDAYNTLLDERYHIEEDEGQRSFKAIKDNIEYDVEEITECRYFKDDEEVYPREFLNETIEELKRGIKVIRKATTYIQRIDWLLSGDDGEETFHERLKKDLQDIESN